MKHTYKAKSAKRNDFFSRNMTRKINVIKLKKNLEQEKGEGRECNFKPK